MSLNSLERLIGILDVFEEAPGVFTAEQLHDRLGYTRSTMYRYLKTLSDAGLLTSYQSRTRKGINDIHTLRDAW